MRNQEYWRKKILKNMERDKQKFEELKLKKWRVCTVWECEVKDKDSVIKKIEEVMGTV